MRSHDNYRAWKVVLVEIGLDLSSHFEVNAKFMMNFYVLGKTENSFQDDEEVGFLKNGLVQGRWCIADEKPVTIRQILEDEVLEFTEVLPGKS